MKILVAPQEFKGSISALSVAEAAETGVMRVFPEAEVVLCPVADGGDGTLETLVEVSGGEVRTCSVQNPIGETITAQWGAMGDGVTAVIEMARTSGLALLSLDERDPLNSSTFGLGQAILEALNQGFRKFIVGIGGSATNDAGAGMAQALGATLLNAEGKSIPFGGAALADLRSIDISKMDTRIENSQFMVACDVSNPLTGDEGASAVYGPQKGATPEMVAQLDNALLNFAEIVKKDIGKNVSEISGAGAAGGLGAGMLAFMGAELKAGVDIVLETVQLREKLSDVDLVITGEGGMDFQTVYNKAPIGVARIAGEFNIPTIAIAGLLGQNFTVVHDHGIRAATSIVDGPISLEESSERASELISNSVEESLRFISVGMDMR
ncbi:MAG: glycerate kinase [SAR202 cluster bacterium]|jgi:glycerate kinase|nr:MAG: glycerate kinase [SAR202 cluster bacterium]KAA1302572.1 MAG: glycerate kinase [SAR202 cluster bacterium]MEC7733243.1 glycerate kinase [Chloroflexota bacterium]|tara:strand:+ start:4039 stop:5181 length:1143 start_codon:yes stop_codon:yes gene_type:complete